MIPCCFEVSQMYPPLSSSRSEFPEIADQSDSGHAGLLFVGQLGDFDMVVPLSQQNLPEGFHHLGNFYPLRTADVAGIAGCANPDGFGFEELLFEPELGEANNLIGQDVHFGDSWAPGRAFAALITDKKLLAAQLLDLLNKRAPYFFLGEVGSHVFCSFQIGQRNIYLSVRFSGQKMTFQ
jgi:hypothetical protein